MGRDTIQLEDVVSTISVEYLQGFTSEFYIPESLHPELPGPEETIVDFPEGKVGVYTEFFEFANYRIPISQFLFYILGWMSFSKRPGKKYPAVLYKAPRLLEELEQPLLLGRREDISYRYGMTRIRSKREDATRGVLLRGGCGDVKHSPYSNLKTTRGPIMLEMDLFNLISAPNPTKVKTGTRPRASHEVPLLIATASRIINMEDMPAVLVSSETPPAIEKSPLGFSNEDTPQLITEGDETENQVPTTVSQEDTPAVLQSVNEPDPLSYARPRPIPEQDIAQSSKEATVAGDPDYERLLKKAVARVARRDQRIQTREREIKNLDVMLEAEANMKKAAEAKNAELMKELESLRVQFSDLQVSNNQLSQQVSTLQAQITGDERIKAAFEEFKKYEDDRVNSRCAEMDARLDALSIDFDEELYPHMLMAIVGLRWIIGHGLRLAVMKCAESVERRQVFTDVVSAGITKGMSEGLKHGIEHGKAKLDLAAIKAYDSEAEDKYITALHALKDLKYPLVDQLEKLKDAPIDLKIPVYPEVRDPKDPWAFKEEILLGDAIAANISRAEKKKKCRVVCRTHGVGSAHHARSDGVPVSVPTVSPQGLAILLADVATQTEDEASPKLLRSKSLPPMYNLEWP
ncbi:hypothetical protein Tco_1246113 [Tanacetum coccineum]